MQRPLFIVLSAPSGAGKTTLCDRLLEDFTDLIYSVSCTTREPRGEEVDGEDYHFVTPAGFEERVRQEQFLEYAEVHGARYGTLKFTVREALDEGQGVLLDIDVEGARQVREFVAKSDVRDPIHKGFIDIFIQPPSLEALGERLEARGENSAEEIAQRIQNAEQEMHAAGEYRYRITNDDLEVAYREIKELLIAEAASPVC